MNDELDRTWKETTAVYLKLLSRHLPRATEEYPKRPVRTADHRIIFLYSTYTNYYACVYFRAYCGKWLSTNIGLKVFFCLTCWFQSEYVASHDLRRGYISGFTGSAGDAVVTLDRAALWTDSRYYLQAENQLDCNWILMKSGYSDVSTYTMFVHLYFDPPTYRVGHTKYLVERPKEFFRIQTHNIFWALNRDQNLCVLRVSIYFYL